MRKYTELIIIGIGYAIVAALVAVAYHNNEACKATGGVLMRERFDGYECVKVERAK